MAKGYTCPNCGSQTAHNKGSHHECSRCRTILWDLGNIAFAPGSGRGAQCHHCGNFTLHEIHRFEPERVTVRRCSTCQGVLIVPESL